jgi:hypothetical protein
LNNKWNSIYVEANGTKAMKEETLENLFTSIIMVTKIDEHKEE